MRNIFCDVDQQKIFLLGNVVHEMKDFCRLKVFLLGNVLHEIKYFCRLKVFLHI